MKRKKLLSTLMALFMILTNVLNPQLIQTIFADSDEPDTEDVEEKEDGEDVEVHDLNDDEDSDGDDDVEQANPESDDDGNQEDNESDEADDKGTDDEEEKDNKDPPAGEKDKEKDTDDSKGISGFRSKNIPTPAAEGKELENVFTGLSFLIDGEFTEIVDGQIIDINNLDANTTIGMNFIWSLDDDVDLKAGDWAEIDLPDIFSGIASGDLTDDEDTDGTYEITEAGKLRIVFNERLTDHTDRSGEVGFSLRYELSKFEENAKQTVELGSGINKEITIKAKPHGDNLSGISKTGKANSKINSKYIDWTIDVNTKLEELKNGFVEDIVPEGLELDYDSIEVHELKVGYTGIIAEGEEITPIDKESTINGFKVHLGKTDKAYRITYRTTIDGELQENYTNKASLYDGNDKKDEREYRVEGLETGSLIEKTGKSDKWDNLNAEQIIWTIDINQAQADLKEVKVIDSIPDGLALNNIKIYELINNGSSWEQGSEVEEWKSLDSFPLELGDIGSKAYQIVVTTDINYGKDYKKEITFENTAALEHKEGTDTDKAEVTVRRDTLIEKTGGETTDYGEPTIKWTINLNKANHVIENAVITDTIGDGLELMSDTVQIKDIKAGKVLSSGDYTADFSNNPFIINLGDIDSEYQITYETKITDEQDDNKYENNAILSGSSGLEGVDIGELEKKPTVVPNKSNTYNKIASGINYTDKTMSWILKVDALKKEITELKITDSFDPAQSMVFLSEGFEVKTGNDTLIIGEDYTLVDKGADGFVLEFKDGGNHKPLKRAQYTITYRTSFDPDTVLEAEGQLNNTKYYKNKAHFEGKTKYLNKEEKINVEKDATQNIADNVFEGGKKVGSLNRETRTITWTVYTNALGQNLIGEDFVITDTLSEGQVFKEDSLEVFEYSLDSSSGNFSKGNPITTGYTPTTINSTDNPFILTFTDGINKPIMIQYQTKIEGISLKEYKNTAEITGKDDLKKEYEDDVSYADHNEFIDKSGDTQNIAYIDDEINWKVNINKSLSDLKDVVFKDTISAGQVLLEDSFKLDGNSIKPSITKQQDGTTDIRFELGDVNEERKEITYTTVVTAENGSIISNKASLESKGEIADDDLKSDQEYTATLSSWGSGTGTKPSGKIEISKVNDLDESLGDAGFKIYYKLGDEKRYLENVDSSANEEDKYIHYTNSQGKLTFAGLPFRTYHIKEVEAPEGYRILDEAKEWEFTLENTKENKEQNLTVKNKEQVSIPITKIWNDDDDTNRPDLIEVKLTRKIDEDKESEVVGTEKINQPDWQYTFESNEKYNLDKYDDEGNEYEYDVSEVTSDKYDSEVSGNISEGFTITNTRVGTTEVSGKKIWDDVTEDYRPELIKVQLVADGKDYGESVDVTEQDDWKYNFGKLPKYDDKGKEIAYVVKEVELPKGYNFSRREDTYDIKNTQQTTELSGEKTWVEEDENYRPDSIQIQLLANKEDYGEPVIVEEDDNGNWKYTFDNLPEYDKEGKEITYSVKEVDLPGYTSTVTGNNITNTQETTSVEVTKDWVDYDDGAYRPDSIQVQLLANGDEENPVETETITANDDWKYTFENLPTHDKEGTEISYSVKEVEVKGFIPTYSTNENDPTKINVLNTQETIEIEGTKTWKDEDKTKDRPEKITIEVLIKDTTTVVAEKEISSKDDQEYSFENLPRYDKAGEEIDYVINEKKVDGYEATIGEDSYNITNTRTDKTNISVMKKWLDEDEKDRPESINVQLYQNDSKHEDEVTISADDDWIYTFKDLDQFDDDGQPYTYTIEEINVDDKYTTEDPQWIAGDNGFVITNVRTGEKSIDITKKWDEVSTSDRPDLIEVELFRSIEDGTAESVKVYEVKGSKDEENWALTISDLPEFDEEGKEYTYSIEEEQVDGYLEADLTGNETDGFVITNKQKTYAIGDYTWIDENKDGIQDEDEPVLPGVIVELYDENGEKIAETTTDENGLYIFDELPAGNYQLKFELTEEQAKKYEFTKQNAGDDTKVDSDADRKTGWTTNITLNNKNDYLTTEYKDQDFEATEGIDPTWDAGVILREKIDVSGRKTWDDSDNQDGKRPESITINLLADGEKIASKEVTAKDDWSWVFEDLYKSEAGSNEDIVYTITEEAVEDYSTVIKGNDYNVTNSYTPGKTSVQVTKAWVGEKGKSVDVKLLADGKDTGEVLTLTADNSWTDTFIELDEYKAGKLIEYTVEEVEIDEYNTEITGDSEKGFVITNTQKTYAIGDYVWIDKNKNGKQDSDEERLPGVKVELFDEDGKKVAETTTDKNGRYIFDELPAGKYKVKFTLTKEQAKKYEFTQQHAGKDDAVDSNADPKTGWTIDIVLNDENSYLTKDYTDQDFKATEGIDPTWDAGVILKDTPEDPKDPEKPEEPSKPEESEKDEKESKDDSNLPKTGETTFVWLAISLILIGLGLAFVKEARKEE